MTYADVFRHTTSAQHAIASQSKCQPILLCAFPLDSYFFASQFAKERAHDVIKSGVQFCHTADQRHIMYASAEFVFKCQFYLSRIIAVSVSRAPAHLRYRHTLGYRFLSPFPPSMRTQEAAVTYWDWRDIFARVKHAAPPSNDGL